MFIKSDFSKSLTKTSKLRYLQAEDFKTYRGSIITLNFKLMYMSCVELACVYWLCTRALGLSVDAGSGCMDG